MEQQRIDNLLELEQLIGQPMDFAKIQRVFSLNNYFLPGNFEPNIPGCGSCQTTVKERVFNWFNNFGIKELDLFRNPPEVEPEKEENK